MADDYPNKMSAEALAEILQRAPFHRWLGLELAALEADTVRIWMPWREELVSNVKQGNAHGGVLASLIDLTAVFAILAKLGRGAPTVDMRVDYHRPAYPPVLIAVGRVIRLGRTVSTAEARVEDGEGRLLASGRGTFLTAEPGGA